MDFTFKKRAVSPSALETERRRIGLVAHDERGNAFVNWRDAPADHERPVLEILGEPALAVRTEEPSFDPYARTRAPRTTLRPAGGNARTDLRRLRFQVGLVFQSEHIKLMRALEERKRNGGDED